MVFVVDILFVYCFIFKESIEACVYEVASFCIEAHFEQVKLYIAENFIIIFYSMTKKRVVLIMVVHYIFFIYPTVWACVECGEI